MKNLYILIFVLFPIVVIGQTTTENYVHSIGYQEPYIDTYIENNSINSDHKIENVTYYDGLGRSIQSISLRAGNQKQDLITHMNYDLIGRMPIDYLPYPELSNNGNYYTGSNGTSLENELKDYYKNKFPNDFYQPPGYVPGWDNPFAQKILEDSPSSRLLEQGAPGLDWRANYGAPHTIKYEYKTNATGEVRYFAVNYTNGDYLNPTLEYIGNYTAGELYKNVIKDENWTAGDNNTTQEFKTKRGQVVLKRTFDSGQAHDTYYVYDDFGNLIYVLSPEASDNILTGGQAINLTALDNLGYQYKYDSRNRLIDKKIPSKGWEYIIYDDLDRPILTQDEELRQDNKKWLFTKYDDFGRVVYTGIYTPPAGQTRAQIENASKIPQVYSEERTTNVNSIGDTDLYYTNFTFPNVNLDLKVLTVSYYDNYVDTNNMTVPAMVYGTPTASNVKGLPTVSKVRVMDDTTNDWITSFTGYDDKGRAIYVRSVNEYLDSDDISYTQLDFTGKVIESTSTHSKGINPVIHTYDYFTYDHMGRMLKHQQKINDEQPQLISSNHYDELGQLIIKEVGGIAVLDGYTDLGNVDVTSDGLITSTNASEEWKATLKTKGEIPSEVSGGIDFIVEEDNRTLRVGLLKTSNSNLDPEYFDYGISLSYDNINNLNDVKIIVAGVEQTTSYGTYQTGDLFRVIRSSLSVKYYHNNNLLMTIDANSTPVLPTDHFDYPLVGKASFYGLGSISGLYLFGKNDGILQTVNYKYNIRGWLTDINNIDAGENKNDLDIYNDLFNFRINYNHPSDLVNGTPLYNGNISQTIWKTKIDEVKRDYLYSYDDLNRITGASGRQGENLNVSNNTDLQNVSYDKNGNIQSLKRYGWDNDGLMSGMWDDLTYTYTGNQLQKVSESIYYSLREYGFKDGINTGNDYDYDDNGNITKDENKGISSIIYNHLNLPEVVTISNSVGTGTITYTYDATGVKLKKVFHKNGVPDTHTEYAGNFVYSDNESVNNMHLQFFNHPEGYIIPTVVGGTRTEKSVTGFDGGSGTITYSDYNYVFQYKDHLGNVRLSYSDADLNGTIDPTTEIIEESNYYPFGLKQKGYNNIIQGGNDLAQNWKFGGKQYQEELDLNWYDFGFRNYDAALGRWMNLDPLAEDFIDLSPYNYTLNNPVFFIDPDGREAMAPIYDTGGNFLGTDDEGLQGQAIVMDKGDFTQGMSHDDALSKNQGTEGLENGAAVNNLVSHYDGLKDRPDYDGFVTRSEGIDWAKANPGALENPTADNTLYLDSSKLDFGNLSTSNFATVGNSEPQNLLNLGNLAASSVNDKLKGTVYALGRVDMILNNKTTGNVSIVNNEATDYDWNLGGSPLRKNLIRAERALNGLNNSHGFKTFYYGTGTLNKPSTFTPQFPTGNKL